MKKTYYIKNNKPKSSVWFIAFILLLADKINEEWFWGIAIFISVLMIIGYVYQLSKYEEIDLLEGIDDKDALKKSFKEYLEERIKNKT